MEDIASIRSSLEGTSESENLDVIRRMALKHIEDFVLGTSESENLDVLRRMALKHIEDFVRSFSDPQVFATALASTVPTSLAQITEGARIPEAAHLRCRFRYLGIPTFSSTVLKFYMEKSALIVLHLHLFVFIG